MAELLKEYKNIILSYHEHDSLLENKQEEELTEEVKLEAWQKYEMESALMHVDNKTATNGEWETSEYEWRDKYQNGLGAFAT